MLSTDIQQLLLKALLDLVIAVVVVGLGWLVGQRLTVYWAIRQKRRELDLQAVNEFYRLYGEFFAIWKLWNYYLDSTSDRSRYNFTPPEATRWSLLHRASAAEGSLESLFVKISSEKPLTSNEIEVLGRFRQAYQKLRESIREREDFGWYSSNHPEYLSFKRLAHLAACLILSDVDARQKLVRQTSGALEKINTNNWETGWTITDEDWGRLQSRG